MQNYPMNLFFATAWLVVLVFVFSPETVGQWQAKRDVAYDGKMSEYWQDCDCTEELE